MMGNEIRMREGSSLTNKMPGKTMRAMRATIQPQNLLGTLYRNLLISL